MGSVRLGGRRSRCLRGGQFRADKTRWPRRAEPGLCRRQAGRRSFL